MATGEPPQRQRPERQQQTDEREVAPGALGSMGRWCAEHGAVVVGGAERGGGAERTQGLGVERIALVSCRFTHS
jgi:hypothetical protein